MREVKTLVYFGLAVLDSAGCFEDYMDFREEVDKIKKKSRAKERAKSMLVPCRSNDKAPNNLQAT
jgi:hypothetical protein